jgi:RNA polymerase sigma-70 factor (ECF subfamily)
VAEELAQDAFEAAYRHWDRVRAYDEPGAWVRRVVANRCVSAWRRGVTEARLLARLRRERVAAVELPERVGEVWVAVRALPRRQRQVMALVVLEGRSVAEVARVLACSEESVRTHLRRARSTLARRLQAAEGSDDA